MYAKKVDINQKEIVKAFRQLGAVVIDLSKVGKGVPDLIIGFKGNTIFVEIKSSSKAKFTPCQLEFIKEWQGGKIERVETIDDVVNIINAINRKEQLQ